MIQIYKISNESYSTGVNCKIDILLPPNFLINKINKLLLVQNVIRMHVA
jgi:hypothetical protein